MPFSRWAFKYRVCLILGLIIIGFLLQTTYKLDARVVMDEAWLSAPAWSLANSGKFNIPVFRGSFDGVDKICFYPPLQLLMLAGVYKVFGFSLMCGRLLFVAFGAMLIIGVYFLLIMPAFFF